MDLLQLQLAVENAESRSESRVSLHQNSFDFSDLMNRVLVSRIDSSLVLIRSHFSCRLKHLCQSIKLSRVSQPLFNGTRTHIDDDAVG